MDDGLDEIDSNMCEMRGVADAVDRRAFIGIVSATLISVALGAKAYGMQSSRRLGAIGVQLYTIRNALTADLDGSLARVAEIGYREVELAGYRSHTVAEFKAALGRHGLVAPSTHMAMERVRDELPKVLDEAHTLGHRFVICPNIPDEKSGLDGYRKAADLLNHAGAMANQAGITIGYHNHDSELAPIDGIRPYDVLLDRTDPKLVTMEMDIYWLVKGGGDPLAYFSKYPGRFTMVHVKGMDSTPQHRMTDVGEGAIDWARLFQADPAIEHYFVEHDEAADPFASIAASYEYLSRLEIHG